MAEKPMQKTEYVATPESAPDTGPSPEAPLPSRAAADDFPPAPLTLAPPPEPPKWGPLRWTLFGLLFAACAFTRLYDIGDKALMHDESLFVYYTEYQLHRAWTYNYMPILHGPLMIEIQAMIFHIFGNSDFTMRLGCALLGIAGFFLIFRMKPFMGEAGTWAALVFYTVSTGLAFYSRFFRNDALFHFLSLLIVLCACNWYRSRSRRWLIGLVVSVTLMFCNKENSVMFYFSGITFFLFWVIQDLTQWVIKGKGADALAAEPRPESAPARFPNVFWFAVAIWAFLILVLTQTFEGIKYDADVVRAINHDFALKDVRSIKLLFGILPSTVDNANLSALKLYETPTGWRLIYGCGFLATLAALWIAKIAVRAEVGHREVIKNFWNGIARNAWWFAGAVFLSIFLYLGIFTTGFANPRGPFQIYRDTFGYWAGQHAWGRIDGPFQYQMVITLIYELPAVIIMVAAWIFAMARTRWGRAWALPVLGLVTIACLIAFNSDWWKAFLNAPIYGPDGKAILFARRADYLHRVIKFNSGVHVYLILFLSYCCVVLTWAALWRGQIFHAWLIWWSVTSIGAYSYAGEKVPWVGTHMMLPIILLAASYTGKLWNAWGHRRRAWFFVLFGLVALWNTKALVNACFRNNDDIRERILYGHTSKDLKHHADAVVRYWERASIRLDWQRNHNDITKLKDVKVLIKATDAAIWPLRWYFRDIEWTEHDDAAKANDKYQFVFLDANDLDKYPNIKEGYTVYRGRGRGFWQPQLPEWQRLLDVWFMLVPRQYLDGQPIASRAYDGKMEWKKLKDYLLLRKTFEKAGASYPSVSSVDYFFCVRKDIDL